MEITEDVLLKRGFIRDYFKNTYRFYMSYYFYSTRNEAYEVYLLTKSDFKYWILQLRQNGLIRQESVIQSLEALEGFLNNLAHESNTYSEINFQYLVNLGFNGSGSSINKFEWRGDFGVNIMMMSLSRYKFLCAIQDLEKTVKRTIESVEGFREFLSDNDLNIFE